MPAVYKIGSLYITKDMVFGWCVARDGETYYPVTSLTHEDIKILSEIHYKQLLTYLRLTKLKLGLLINFNVPLIKNGIHRLVNNL